MRRHECPPGDSEGCRRVPRTEPVAATSTSFAPGQLTPEMIDVIARRVVEMMSDKVVREIAWEVVPDLAELLIKEQLEKQAKKQYFQSGLNKQVAVQGPPAFV